jgi:rod shape-determining protein MreC
MARVTERWESRRDTWTFAGCMLLSALALLMPASWGMTVAAALRTTALAPFVWLQERAAEGRTSRTRFRAVASERDSLAELSRTLSGLVDENAQLRSLLDLTVRTGPGFIPAEVLHQTLPTDGRTLLLDAGKAEGVSPLDPVVTPEGLIGAIREVDQHTSIAMTWAHPEFRVSAVSANGQVAGIVGPTSTGDASRTSLEFRAITYRDTLPDGAMVIASGLGGVYPRGVPVGTVVGVEREQAGWERVYRLRPAAQPSVAGHVLILHGATPLKIPAAFAAGRDTTDSAAAVPAPPVAPPGAAATPKPTPADSAARARRRRQRADSVATAAAAPAAAPSPPPAAATPAPASPTAPADSAGVAR